MDYILPISEARGKLPAILKKLSQASKYLIITKNGRAEAIVMTPEELETLEIKSNPKLMQSLIRAQEDVKARRVYSHDEVFKDV